MRFSNVQCVIEINDLLPELKIHKVIDKIDTDFIHGADRLIDEIKDSLSDSSEYDDHYVIVDGMADLDLFDLKEIEDEILIELIEDKGYTLLSSESDEDSRRTPNQNLHEELCEQFDLSRFTTKQELLKHIHSLL